MKFRYETTGTENYSFSGLRSPPPWFRTSSKALDSAGSLDQC